jgi:WD40 repeat protein
VAFSPDQERIATGSEDGLTRIYNNGQPPRELTTLEGNGSPVLGLAFSPDGQQVITAHRDGTVLRQSTRPGVPPQPFLGHTGAVWSVSVSRDGQQILTGSEDGNAIVWSAESRKPLFHASHGSPVRAVAYLPGGTQFLTASVDGQARLWRSAPGETNDTIAFRGHRGPVWAAACSPNGRRIVTGGADGTVRLWDAISGKEVLTLNDLATDVLAVAFSSPDSRWIMAGAADGTIRLWEAAISDQVAAWQREEEADGQRLAELRRQAELHQQEVVAASAHDPGAIKQWLILAPIRFPGPKWSDLANAIASDTFLAGRADPLPRAGERVLIGTRYLAWQAAHFNDHVIDFGAFLGRGVHWPSCLLYAVTYIQSETEQSGLILQLGWDDYAKIELNRSTLYNSEQSSWTGRDAVRVPNVSLRRGQNVLVLKSANWIGGWYGALRFATADGQPVRGLKVTLEPEAKALSERVSR